MSFPFQDAEDVGDPDEARQALEHAGFEPLSAETAQRIVRLYLLKAESLGWEARPGSEEHVTRLFESAKSNAMKYLHEFRTAKNSQGEASMLLAWGQAEFEKLHRENARANEFRKVLQNALKAQNLTMRAYNLRLQAEACVLESRVHRKMESNPTCWKSGNHVRTLDALRKAVKLFEEANDAVGAARAENLLGDAHFQRHEDDEAAEVMVSALNRLKKPETRREEAMQGLSIAEQRVARKWGKLALPLAEDVLEMLEGLDPPSRHLARAYHVIVQSHTLKGDLGSALRLAEEWVDKFRERRDLKQLTATLVTLAEVYLREDNPEDALSLMEEARSAVEELGDTRFRIDLLLRYADVARGHCKFEQAESLAREGIRLSQQVGDKLKEALSLGSLNLVHLDRYSKQDDDQAYREYKKTANEQKAMFLEIGETSRAAQALVGVCGLIGNSGKYVDALRMAEECQGMFIQAEDKEGEARALSFITEIYSDMAREERDDDKYKAAEDKANEMRACAQAVGCNLLEARALNFTCSIHTAHRDYHNAARAAREALACAKRESEQESVLQYTIFACQAYLNLANDELQDDIPRIRPTKGTTHAIRHAKEAVNLARVLRREPLVAKALLMMCDVQIHCGQNDDAMNTAREAKGLFSDVEDKAGEAKVTARIAQVHFFSNRMEEAMDACQGAFDLVAEIQDALEAEDVLMFTNAVVEQIQGSERAQSLPELALRQKRETSTWQEQAQMSGTKGLNAMAVEQAVMEFVKISLGPNAKGVRLDSPLQDHGMDSLCAVTLRNGVAEQLGVRLSTDFIFDFPTGRSIAKHLRRKLGG